MVPKVEQTTEQKRKHGGPKSIYSTPYAVSMFMCDVYKLELYQIEIAFY